MSCKQSGIIYSDNVIDTYLGVANDAISFYGVVTNLNNNESSYIYFSANDSTLQIAVLVLGNLF